MLRGKRFTIWSHRATKQIDVHKQMLMAAGRNAGNVPPLYFLSCLTLCALQNILMPFDSRRLVTLTSCEHTHTHKIQLYNKLNIENEDQRKWKTHDNRRVTEGPSV